MHYYKISIVSSKKKRTILSLVVIAVVVGAAVALTIKILDSPATGTIITPTANSTVLNTLPKGPQAYSDKYIGFDYPPTLTVTNSSKDISSVDVVNLYSARTDHSNEHVAVAITHETLASDSGLKYRRDHPELYKEESLPSGMAVFSSDKNGHEKTGFIAHGDSVLSVSITVPGSKDLTPDFNLITSSLTWK
jgi:hypothetical protein